MAASLASEGIPMMRVSAIILVAGCGARPGPDGRTCDRSDRYGAVVADVPPPTSARCPQRTIDKAGMATSTTRFEATGPTYVTTVERSSATSVVFRAVPDCAP